MVVACKNPLLLLMVKNAATGGCAYGALIQAIVAEARLVERVLTEKVDGRDLEGCMAHGAVGCIKDPHSPNNLVDLRGHLGVLICRSRRLAKLLCDRCFGDAELALEKLRRDTNRHATTVLQSLQKIHGRHKLIGFDGSDYFADEGSPLALLRGRRVRRRSRELEVWLVGPFRNVSK